MKVVSDVLLLSYLDKFGLQVTVEAGQALACLYSEARLYKRPGLANPSQSTWNSEFFVLLPLKITAALSLHFQHLYED